MIIVKLQGGIGNQMFEYALGRALSLKNRTPLGLDLTYLLDRTSRSNFTFRDYDLDVFNIDAKIVKEKDIPFIYRKHFRGKFGLFIYIFLRKIFKLGGIEKKFSFDKKILELGDNIYLDGYWQSPKYFSNIEDVLRKDFTLKNPLQENIQKLLTEIKNENALCVHVRRKDFVGNTYHDVIKDDYYLRALDYILKKVKIDKIYVFSDDIDWCKKNIRFDISTFFVDNEYAGEKATGHLFLMSACKYFIIPNSTFSWWAAWLCENTEKIVVAPKQWFKNKNIISDDLIPEKWIKI